jgi:hypothetical protein
MKLAAGMSLMGDECALMRGFGLVMGRGSPRIRLGLAGARGRSRRVSHSLGLPATAAAAYGLVN